MEERIAKAARLMADAYHDLERVKVASVMTSDGEEEVVKAEAVFKHRRRVFDEACWPLFEKDEKKEEPKEEPKEEETIPHSSTRFQSFLNKHREDIRQYFLQQPRTQPPLKCYVTKLGYCTIRTKDRIKYRLPAGIQGTVYRTKPVFKVRFRQQLLSGKLLGLKSEETEFEDPRDVASILRKLDALYATYSHKV
jgi:hypothetical protein